eukprot:scaffold192_cov320-Ochromonas_danica.AAC.21
MGLAPLPTESNPVSLLAGDDPDPPSGFFQRAVPFTVLTALAVAISYADRANLSTAIIPMASELKWSTTFSGWVLSVFWAGYALTQVVGGRLADRFGGEVLLVAALLLWSLCTGLTPYAASLGGLPLLLDRLLLGAGEGFALPAVHSMIRKYVSPSKRSTSASIVTAACYLGSLASNALCPSLIDRFGWRACFALFAVLPPLVWLPLWLGFIGQSRKAKPQAFLQQQQQQQVEEVEEVEVVKQQVKAEEEVLSLRQLLSSRPVWAIIAAQYGQSWGMIGLLSWLPTYYSERFGVSLSALGGLTALPYLLQLGTSLFAGVFADRWIRTGKRVLHVRHVLQSVGMIGPALGLALCAGLSSAPTAAAAYQASFFITIGSALSALTCGAVSCNHFDISPKNAGTIFGLGNTASCLAGLIAVPLSGYLLDVTKSWELVFTLFAGHYLVGLALWLWWASDEPLRKSVNKTQKTT